MISGFLLVGGAGSRMGGGKALKLFRGRPLWSYGYELLNSFCASVQLVGECGELGMSTLVEEQPGRGPLGGIVAALKATQTDWNFLLALDYPLLDRAFVETLGRPQAGLARLPACGEQKHPLCGYYHREVAERLPQQGSVLRALQNLDVQWVDFGGDERFLNVNRPEDLLAYKRCSDPRAETPPE